MSALNPLNVQPFLCNKSHKPIKRCTVESLQHRCRDFVTMVKLQINLKTVNLLHYISSLSYSNISCLDVIVIYVIHENLHIYAEEKICITSVLSCPQCSESYPLEYGVSRSTPTVPYTHTRQNRQLSANRQREIYRHIVEPQTLEKPHTAAIFCTLNTIKSASYHVRCLHIHSKIWAARCTYINSVSDDIQTSKHYNSRQVCLCYHQSCETTLHKCLIHLTYNINRTYPYLQYKES